LSFVVGRSDAFEIPLPAVQQCPAGKNEVALEFHANDESAVSLSEIRFHIPSSEAVTDQDPVELFKEAVLSKASVMATSGDAIAILREVSALSPRGRFSIKIFPPYVHLHGKSFDYKIPATSMVRLFLLPHKDSRQMHVAVNVDPPMKQGQTRYHYLVLIFKEEEEIELELPFTEDEIQEKYDGKLKKEMNGKTYEVITDLFKAIASRKITTPGSFLGHSGTPAITCSYRAASGFVYPLERGLIYIYKPPIYLRFDEMQRVEFERTGGTSRSFDIKVNTIHDIIYTFSSIEKGEYSRLYDYLKSKQIKVTTTGKLDGGGTLQWDDKEKEIDHHLERVKEEAELFSSGGEDMSSDDTDFKPDDLEALSAKEEYDSEPSTTSTEDVSDDYGSGSDADRKRAEKRKQKAEKKAEKEKKKEKKASDPAEKRPKKKKMTKLPGQPKKNQSAYFLWMNQNREKIKKDYPGLSMTEMSKKAGESWRDMKDKSKWNAKAEEDKKRYEKEMEKWKAEGGDEALKAAKKQAKKEKRASVASGPTENKFKSSTSAKISSVGTGSHFKSKEYIESTYESSS
jgi:structure-specific recognition protein 1